MTIKSEPFTLGIEEDDWAPTYEGARLETLRSEWIEGGTPSVRFPAAAAGAITSIALVGAVRSNKTGKLNLRDEIACRAIIQSLVASVPLTSNCAVELFNLAEKKDIFATDKSYDLVIFCNLREIHPVLIKKYNELRAADRLTQILETPRLPFGDEPCGLDRDVADALKPSDILTGYRYAGISHEHKYYMTISEKALRDDAYSTLAKKLNARFIACWGFVGFIHGGYFHAPALYDRALKPGVRLTSATNFTRAQSADCARALMGSFEPISPRIMREIPWMSCAVRNDVLEEMWERDRDGARKNPLFSGGIETLDKLDLQAQLKSRRGRKPIATSWGIAGKSITDIHRRISRPLSKLERAELYLRRQFG